MVRKSNKLWIVLSGILTVVGIILGVLTDGFTIFDRFQKSNSNVKTYYGRFGASFEYPESWDVYAQPEFASMARYLIHPTNSEVYLSYSDFYEYSPNEYSFEIQNEDELKSFSGNNKIKVLNSSIIQKKILNYPKTIEIGKIYFESTDKEGRLNNEIKIFTYFEGHSYYLTLHCPKAKFEKFELEFGKILSSFSIDYNLRNEEYHEL